MQEIELTKDQKQIFDLVHEIPAPAKHAARSAVSHILKAWKLKEVDPEMAVFRAITGEEESVTAIFQSIIRRQYVNANMLKPKWHVHKSALHPFLQAIENNLIETKVDQFFPAVELDTNEKPYRFKIRLTLSNDKNETFYAYPDPPFNFMIKQNGEIYNFASELLKLTDQKTIDKIIDHLNKLADRRNEILYASSNGIPKVLNLPDKFLLDRKDRIFRNLILLLLIDAYPVQSFIQQALNAFLEILGRLPSEGA